jgi:hypothetical protein
MPVTGTAESRSTGGPPLSRRRLLASGATAVMAVSVVVPAILPALAEAPSPGERSRPALANLVVLTRKGRFLFQVEIAATEAERQRGLQGRRRLAVDGGMLFDFERPGPVRMWMKDTLIPLDMLFIDASGRIVAIQPRTRPMSLDIIEVTLPVRAVLELNGGTAAAIGAIVGDRVCHPLFEATGC